MGDIIDQAQDREAKDRKLSIEAVKAIKGPAAKGYCLNCGPDVPIAAGLRWCDGDCRDDWQRRKP